MELRTGKLFDSQQMEVIIMALSNLNGWNKKMEADPQYWKEVTG